MEITLEEAAHGKDAQIRIPTWDSCETCKGTGAKPGTSAKTCTTCNGSSTVHIRQGFFSIQQTCPHCQGTDVRCIGRVERSGRVSLFARPWLSGPAPAYTDTS